MNALVHFTSLWSETLRQELRRASPKIFSFVKSNNDMSATGVEPQKQNLLIEPKQVCGFSNIQMELSRLFCCLREVNSEFPLYFGKTGKVDPVIDTKSI